MLNLKKYISGEFSELEFERISEALITLKLDQNKRKHWKEILEKDYNLDRAGKKKIKWFRPGFFSLSLIASTLILVLAYIFLMPNNMAAPYMAIVDKNIEKLSTIMVNQTIIRKGGVEVNLVREQATITYLDKKYEDSSIFWKQLVDSNLASGQDLFYFALCQLQKKRPNPKEAIELLLESKTNNGPKEEISWALSLAYLKAGLIEEGRQELIKIIEQKAYKVKEAKDILNALNE